MRALRAITAAAVAAVALLLGGCGSSGSGTTSAASSAPSNTGTSATGTASAPASTSTIQQATPTTSSSTTTSTTAASSSTTPSASGGAGLASGFHVSSPAFSEGGSIPSRYTCDGEDVSLPLQWSGVPTGTQELVLVMRDPDAPGGDFVHWAVAGIQPTATGFPAGGVGGQVAPGRNSFGTLGYRGPCPPTGDKPHQYVITLSALASASGLRAGFTADQLQTKALGIATLTGTYARR